MQKTSAKRTCSFSHFEKTAEQRTQLNEVDTRISSLVLTAIDVRGTQRKYSSKPLKHRIVERILVFKR